MRLAVFLILLAALAACGTPPEAAGLEPGRPQGASLDDNRTLVIAMRTEPKVFVGSDLDPTHVGATPNSPWQLFHAALTQTDDRGTTVLQLAEGFPELGTDSWKVFPDGRMETTWRLRPNLSWHDGTPLSADDFVLAIRFSKTMGRAGGSPIESATALDSRTLLIRYQTPTPDAAEAIWQPLPAHVVGAAFETMDAREFFDTLPFWTSEFIGLGPYQVERWEPGAFITGVAFPNYVNGKPKIARIQLVWQPDANTAVANLLSGSVHFATDLSLAFPQASVLRREWAGARQPGTVLLGTSKTVYTQVQARPDYARPAALLDVRFRRALAHAIDKQAIVDAVLDGEPGIADTFMAKEEESYAELDKVLTRYRLDPRRTDQLMSDVGFTKDAEGFYGQSGARLAVGIQVAGGGGGYLNEALVVADSWKRVGIDTQLRTLSANEQVDQETISTYPSLYITQRQIFTNPFLYFTTATLARPATKWEGRNKMGFFDPELDRLSDLYNASLDRHDRINALVQGMKLVSDQSAYYPLYYGYDVIAGAGGLIGPRGARKDNAMWKVEEWTWAQ